jgi:predicted ester cyclase
MDEADLEATYRAYLEVLNDRRFDELTAYVHDDITYNDEPITRSQYQRNRADEVDTIPDLAFQIGTLVVQGNHVACRLWFECTPVRAFLGFEPTGATISFAEHVFYEFDGGRIKQVRSLLDRAAVASQLAQPR